MQHPFSKPENGRSTARFARAQVVVRETSSSPVNEILSLRVPGDNPGMVTTRSRLVPQVVDA
ncbi:MAG: hypothetical protein LBG44_04865 [Gemmatimonadota bacterium]|nr:hypothetical protein [Gemmatimonadota bacterium]